MRRQPFPTAMVDDALTQSCGLCLITDDQPFTIKLDPDIPARVSALLSASRPSAVLLRIGSIIINAIQRMFLARPWSNVSVKRFERIPPFLRHHNPARTVCAIPSTARIEAAFFRHIPDAIFRSVRQSVCDCASGRRATFTRITLRHGSACEIVSAGELFIPAVTLTAPSETVPSWIMAAFDHGQAGKSNALQGLWEQRHRFTITPVSM